MLYFSNLFFKENRWFKSCIILFFSIFTIILLYRNTAFQMVKLWTVSDTYAHGFIVPFISLWLIWRARPFWIERDPQPSLIALLLIFIFSLFWLLGDLVAINAVTQLSFVTMIALCIPAVVGWKISSVITFPIAFLFFAVPIGDFLLPAMMNLTADFTVVALRLTGIPVYREGLQFVIPSGRWSVVEACSGIRYLLASLTVGSLFAYLNYKSVYKRLAFFAFAIIVPLVANWLRAYMIVLIGHYSGNELATGIDHLIYGWVFFGLVILLMLFIGMKWADSDDNKIHYYKKQIPQINKKIVGNYKTYFFILIIAAIPHFLNRLISLNNNELPVVLRNIEINKNWQPDDVSSNDWKPSFPSAVSFYDNIYTAKENSRVGLHISYYRQQNYQSKLITSTNTLLNAEDKRLRKISTENANFQLNEKTLSVESSLLKFNGILEEKENTNILAWKFYWVDGKFTANKFYAKILGALSQIKGKGDDGAIIVVYAKFYDDQAYAKKALESFMKDNEKNIENALLKTKNN